MKIIFSATIESETTIETFNKAYKALADLIEIAGANEPKVLNDLGVSNLSDPIQGSEFAIRKALEKIGGDGCTVLIEHLKIE